MDALETRAAPSQSQLDSEQQGRQREWESLQLSRARVMRDLEAAKHPRHRESVQAALRFLDEKIAALGIRSE